MNETEKLPLSNGFLKKGIKFFEAVFNLKIIFPCKSGMVPESLTTDSGGLDDVLCCGSTQRILQSTTLEEKGSSPSSQCI